jgi:hypothetical protein
MQSTDQWGLLRRLHHLGQIAFFDRALFHLAWLTGVIVSQLSHVM